MYKWSNKMKRNTNEINILIGYFIAKQGISSKT